MLSELKNVTAAYLAISRSDAPSPPVAESAPVVKEEETGASPRLKIDPVAGVIFEFLGADGEVATQSPSFAAVAYLRAGLTSEGFRREEDNFGAKLTA